MKNTVNSFSSNFSESGRQNSILLNLSDNHSIGRLNGTRSLPLPAENEDEHPLTKELRRVASWSYFLESFGEEEKSGGGEEWWVDMSQLLIGEKFASGMYSRLYHGVYKQRPVAVKIMMYPEGDESVAAKLEKQFSAEASLLFRLRHPNILDFVAACKRPPVFCVITEYLSGGSLRAYLGKQEPHSLPLKLILRMALDIARGMQYLHSQGIIHRDLKSDNLLLDDNMQVKVADFGVSCFESQCATTRKGFMGTYRWMAPEMIKEKPYTRKVDVYSFGVVLWELLTAQVPFEDMSPAQAAFAVSQKNARPPLPTACPPAIAHVIKRCWATEPKRRPHFDHIVSRLEFLYGALREDPAFLLHYRSCGKNKLLQRLMSCFSTRGNMPTLLDKMGKG